jgi:predicted TIM-barrel fold metal-dependent hydrolase
MSRQKRARVARRVAMLCGLMGAVLWGAAVAAAADSYYALADFDHVDKIDAHVHLHGNAGQFMARAIRDDFRLLTINVEYPDFPALADQEAAALDLRRRYPGRVAFVTTFSTARFAAADWAAGEVRHIQAAVAQGAVGVKIWKNIGMSVRDPDGRYVMPDDARMEPIYAEVEREHIVLLGHQAEPLNCWLPMKQMTIRSDREYFTEHPQYYMYDHPDMPSHEAILAARDRMLAAHPALHFDAVHLASLEWDVARIGEFLERFPNAVVDMAARTSHLEHQAARDPVGVRAFFMRYQDRILYGSDVQYGPREGDGSAAAEVHDGWLDDWRFLVGTGRLHSSEFPSAYRGMHLPKTVIDKIYRTNALREFPGGWN